MSFLTSLARGATAFGVASQLGPAQYVNPTVDIIVGVVCFIIVAICAFAVFKAHTMTEKDTSGKETDASMKGIAIGVFASIMAGLLCGLGLNKMRWNFANPGYYAAQQGMDALYK